MPPVIRRLTNNSLVRYIIVGGISFALEISVLFFLIHFFSFSTVAAVAVSFWVGLIASFLAQKYLTFQDNNRSTKRLLKQSIAYGALIAVNYAFTIGFVSLMDSIIGVYVARTVALTITTAWNYIIYAKIIFKKRGV